MNIPSRVNPFGYDNSLPPGYFRVEFLESEGTQYLVLPVMFKDTSGLSVSYKVEPYSGYSYLSIIRYSDKSIQIGRIFADGKTGIATSSPSVTAFVANNGKIFASYNEYESNKIKVVSHGEESETAIPHIPAVGESVTPVYLMAYDRAANLGVYLPSPAHYSLYEARFTLGQNLVNRYVPSLDQTGAPCMYDSVNGQNFYNANTTGSDFIAGLTMRQALDFSNLPATGGSLTVSLPLEAAFDANVQSALNAATAKGWTIIVQYRESELTTKHIDVDFLESTGAQYINTGIVPNAVVEFDMQLAYVYPLNEERGYNMFFGCVVSDSNGQFRLGHSNYYRSTVSVSEGCVLESLVWFRYDVEIEPRRIYSLKTTIAPQSAIIPKLFLDGTQQSYINSSLTSYTYNGIISTPIGLFGRIGGGEAASTGAPLIVKKATIVKGGSVVFDALPCLDSSGTPCMYDTVSDQNFYNANTADGAIPFIVGFESTEKAAVSLSKLPITTGGTLTVSLPEAAQDAVTLVPAAIDIAQNRGWTIITQYR